MPTLKELREQVKQARGASIPLSKMKKEHLEAEIAKYQTLAKAEEQKAKMAAVREARAAAKAAAKKAEVEEKPAETPKVVRHKTAAVVAEAPAPAPAPVAEAPKAVRRKPAVVAGETTFAEEKAGLKKKLNSAQ